MDGIELAARFSYITNSLRFCGPEEASHQFINYIGQKASAESVIGSLKRFEGLYPYLSAIAQKHKKKFYDYDVVESYWLGNSLLDSFEKEDMGEIIRNLMQRGLPKSIGEELIINLPDGLKPHHDFNVFYVGVGRTTGSVATTLQNMDNCRVSWGRVIEIFDDKLIVGTQALEKKGNKLLIRDGEVKTVTYLPEMLTDLRKNSNVAMHWGFAPLILNEIQLQNLQKYTNLTLEIMNGKNQA